MNKKEFFRLAVADDAHYDKGWVFMIFSVTLTEDLPDAPWMVRYHDDHTSVYVPTADGFVWDVLEDATPMEPAFDWVELITLEPGFHPLITKNTLTTWGTFVFNLWAVYYPFELRVGYINPDYEKDPRAYIDIKRFAGDICQKMLDDPRPGEPEDPTAIYVKHYKVFGQSLSRLTGFNVLFVPTGSPKSLTPHPDAKAVLLTRLEENKDRLHDPAVIAKIQDEQVAMDKQHLADDPSMGFFLPGKVWHTARKRMFYIHGPESGLDESATPELIVNSLRDGWDVNKLVVMINSLRAGSYYRGAMTALGGESVKFFLRIFQNVYVSEDDCGSKLGILYTIDKELTEGLVGRYQLIDDKPVLLTKERLNSLIGETIHVRTPWSCKTAESDVCKICVGDRNSETPYALAALEAGLGSTMMLVMMGAAHAKVLSVAELEEDFLT